MRRCGARGSGTQGPAHRAPSLPLCCATASPPRNSAERLRRHAADAGQLLLLGATHFPTLLPVVASRCWRSARSSSAAPRRRMRGSCSRRSRRSAGARCPTRRSRTTPTWRCGRAMPLVLGKHVFGLAVTEGLVSLSPLTGRAQRAAFCSDVLWACWVSNPNTLESYH